MRFGSINGARAQQSVVGSVQSSYSLRMNTLPACAASDMSLHTVLPYLVQHLFFPHPDDFLD